MVKRILVLLRKVVSWCDVEENRKSHDGEIRIPVRRCKGGRTQLDIFFFEM